MEEEKRKRENEKCIGKIKANREELRQKDTIGIEKGRVTRGG